MGGRHLQSGGGRCGKRAYFASKFAAASFSGGLSIALGLTLFFTGFRIVGLPWFTSYFFDSPTSLPYLKAAESNPISFFLWAIYYGFWNGALMAGLAVWVSGYVKNLYVIYTAPAVAVFSGILLAHLFDLPVSLRLDRLLVMMAAIIDETWTALIAALWVLALLIIGWWDFQRRGRKVMGGG